MKINYEDYYILHSMFYFSLKIYPKRRLLRVKLHIESNGFMIELKIRFEGPLVAELRF